MYSWTTGRIALSAILLTAALGVAACGSSSDDNAGSGESGGGSGGGAATVDVADNSDVGQILVDADGNALYLFEKDESDESYCNGGCEKVWPPLTANGEPQAGQGVDASKLDTIKREDGTTQVAYNGHPLYTYTEDTKPGDVSGNEVDSFGAEWYALTPSGEPAEGSQESGGSEDEGSESGSSGGGGGGGSYGY